MIPKQTPPSLKLFHGVNEPLGLYGYKLENWDEVDRWAFENQPLWNQLTKENEMLGLNEEDRLRTLATFYMKKCVELGEKYVRYQMENPAKVEGPNGDAWRYIGP